MDYTPHIRKVFKDALFEDWMNDDDWEELEKEILQQAGTSYEEMSKQIETGINNGHSLEFQLGVINKMLNASKHE
jgi:hypothetical protein